MQTISESLKTILKSKNMMGANAPTAKLTLEGVTLNADLDYTTYSTPYYCGKNASGYKDLISNFVVDANGNEICAVVNDSTGEIYIGHMDNNEDYFAMDYPITSLTSTGLTMVLTDILDCMAVSLYKRDDGKLLLFVPTAAKVNISKGKLECYISDNGLGTDFVLYSTVHNDDAYDFIPTSVFGDYCVHMCSKCNDGNLYITCGAGGYYVSNAIKTGIGIYRSTDNGATWTYLHRQNLGYLGNISKCVRLKDGTLVACALESSYSQFIYYSSDNGTTWTKADRLISYAEYSTLTHTTDMLYDDVTDMLYHCSLGSAKSGYLSGVYVSTIKNPTVEKIINNEWDSAYRLGDSLGSNKGAIFESANGNIALMSSVSLNRIMGVVVTKASVEIPLKSVKIDREQSALAQRLSAEIVNVNSEDPTDVGYYTPFRGIDVPADANAFMGKIKPGTGVTCEMGYGTELTTVFVGAIDDVEISADTSYNIKIECRDNAWKLLDTMVASELGYYVLYQNQTVEYMISDLLQKAGIPSADITTEATGITVAEISFAKCSYADAVEKLLDICGYDLICNELGKFSLVKPGVVTSGGTGGTGTGTEIFAEDHETLTTETIEPTYYIVDGSNLVNETSYWEIATDPADANNKVIKLGNQAESGPPSYYRAEVACLDCTATDGDVTWLTYKMYIPSAHNNNSEWELIMQWHAQPGPGETWEDEGPFHGEPPVRLVRWSETPETYELWLHDPVNLTYAKSDPFELPRDQWMDFTFEIYWSQNSDGYIQMWRDGALVVPKMYHVNKCNVSPNYLQFGSYRRGKDYNDNAATGDAVLYYDDIAIYTGGNVETSEPGLPTTAYEFTEGVDITKMGLKLTRNDIYARVQVTSRIDPDPEVPDAVETYIVKEYIYSNAADYGIPNHKTLFIDVQNITDETEIQNMANQIGYEMTRRLITVEFDCIPVFALQVGDIVKVTETSTTISEFYRVSAMSMGVDANGTAKMSLKCFHYGA